MVPSYNFIHNLKTETFGALFTGDFRPAGFLIAPHYAVGTLRELAGQVTGATRQPLLVDNGNFSTIGQLRDDFQFEAAALAVRTRVFEAELGRSAREGELPADLTAAYDALERWVRAEALRRGLDDAVMVENQMALDPDRIIGAEDLTMATWLSLDIEPRFTSRRRSDYRRYNQSVARRAVSVRDSLPEHLRAQYYPVASAMSYNTAVDAGREFAEAGLQAMSMGFGAFMADANWCDHLIIGRRTVDLGRKLPMRYLRTAAVAAGFWAGYREVSGTAPERFHFLGLGAPVIIPPTVLAARETPHLTFDAMSPILDATKDVTLYTNDPALLKLRTRKIALRLAREPNHEWICPCPFCQRFMQQYPFDYERGHRWFADTAATAVTADDLRPEGPLHDAYPLLSEPRSGERRDAVDYARIGHNHWILERTMTTLESAERRDGLHTRVENLIEAYAENTTVSYATALRVAVSLARGEL